MTDMTVRRRSSDGSTATYLVTLRERTDRTVHEVSLSRRESHRLAKPFASSEDLVGHVIQCLLARGTKEDIPSAFALKDLLDHEPELADDLRDRTAEHDAAILDYLTGASTAH